MSAAQISRRLAEKRARGECSWCALPVAPGSAALCLAHLEQHAAQRRRRTGAKAWEPGSRGRKPLSVGAASAAREAEA